VAADLDLSMDRRVCFVSLEATNVGFQKGASFGKACFLLSRIVYNASDLPVNGS
jgi:hypothetical protein